MNKAVTNTVPIDIEDEMKSSFLEYSMSVIVSRALPDVRDGLKPVHRRILYAMSQMGNHHNKAYKKSARTVGEVIAKYHPHGDTAVYDALVRMAQDFSLRYPLVDGQGNFGSIDGDSAAAMRYTEARLHKVSAEILEDLDKETVEFINNYDESEVEPVALPSKLPNLLVNGSGGIAVGMATNIPPHNLGEIVDGLIHLIDNPDCQITDLMKHIKGPDFPTGAQIHGVVGFRQAYTTGRGHVIMRATATIEPMEKADRERIVVTEIPYQVNKARLIEKIAELTRDKKITGVSDIRDESDRKGMRIVIELRKDAMGQVVLNQLYKHTSMQDTFGVIMIALVEGRPRHLNLKEMLHHFVEHRREVITRRTLFDLRKAEEREHILSGYVKALENLNEVIKLIREAASPDEAKTLIMEKFEFTEAQSKAILALRLQRLTGMERQKIIDERDETLKAIEKLIYIRDHEEEKFRIIKQELCELKDKFGDERRTALVPMESEVETEDLIAEEDMVVAISMSGYIKRNPIDFYRSQKRGGRGVKGIEMKAEDAVQDLFIASTHDNLLFFTNTGRVFRKKVYEIPSASRVARGKAVVNLIQLQPGEKVAAIFPVDQFKQDRFLVIATRNGFIKKTSLDAYSRIHTGGIIAITLEEGDDVIAAKITEGDHNIILTTKKGMAIRFHEKDARPIGRVSKGVRGVALTGGDQVVGLTALAEEEIPEYALFTIKEDGYGKRTQVARYPLQRRSGKGVLDIKCNGGSGSVVAVKSVRPNDELMIINQAGVVIRIKASDISVIGRNTKGVRVISIKEQDKVVSVGRLREHVQGE
ncbi:DNA gyrase subunit A [hydrothermal vent metagenome]|uniref:DNA topoisomerase (ATP-hydrolyzing) n=1 Tax=hydrothermal vent metagenome TaxID=652676 RepID=A0A3B1CAU0_9ZZZZ